MTELLCTHTHTHFSYCVFHKFLFALCNRRLTTKSHKCFRLSTKADMKASVIPMKRCICLSVPCVCVLFACRLSMSVGLLKIYFKYIEIAFGLCRVRNLSSKQRTLWQLQKLLHTFGLRYKAVTHSVPLPLSLFPVLSLCW